MASDEIKHFSHQHPLVLRPAFTLWDFRRCEVCQLGGYGLSYICGECYEFVIHKACAELPQEINHPFHPQHSLTLIPEGLGYSQEIDCSACGGRDWAYHYNCSQCQFGLHVKCAALMPKTTTTKSKNKHEINHYLGEPHPLILCDIKKDTKFYCSACKLVINNGSIYVCLHCKKMLHKSCNRLHQEIKHPLHPDHTLTLHSLTLSDSRRFRCSICGEQHNGLAYRCCMCQNFDIDIKCSFLVPIIDDHYQFCHPHPLILCKSTRQFPFFCKCSRPFKDDDSIFCCLNCKQLLHKSCAELPFEIEHMFHPKHTLWLTLGLHDLDCTACDQLEYDACSAYICNDCEFRMDFRCASPTPLVLNSDLHRHPLAFFSVVGNKFHCEVCRKDCKSDAFRCVPCNFNVHLLCCIPTPPSIASDGNHRHPLTFTKSPVKDYNDEDENSEFLCDRCEKKRRLCDPTYYCAKCHYVAHVHCLISEIVRLVNEEWSLTHKLSDTMLIKSSTDVVEENTNEVIRDALTGELVETKSDSHSSLVDDELDKEINEVQTEVEEQEAKLEALRKRLKALHKRKNVDNIFNLHNTNNQKF